jgi:hypothetical protein
VAFPFLFQKCLPSGWSILFCIKNFNSGCKPLKTIYKKIHGRQRFFVGDFPYIYIPWASSDSWKNFQINLSS